MHEGSPDVVWKWSMQDSRALALLVLLPLAVAAPQILGFLQADPRLWTGAMVSEYVQGPVRGWPYLDPNTGFATQALGHRAMLEWLRGVVPWWNYYSGVGLPLAAEYQPGAFFPLTAFLLLPQGLAWQHAALQILAGAGTYGLLRQVGLVRAAALTGALLYAFDGTLAWHAHAPATAVPFLPWMLWGVERAFACARAREPIAWRLIALAMALGLLCAFPETSYLSGLLALAWAGVRGLQLPNAAKFPYACAVTVGGFVGIGLSAPQLYSFLHFLGESYIGGHAADFAHAAFGWHALASSIATPYLLGPPMGYAEGRILVETVWGGIGGYVTAALVPIAAYGFMRRRDALAWLLLGWCALTLGKSFGVEPIVTLMNLVPGVKLAAFYRYAPPSWELAVVILAARGIDAVLAGSERPRIPVVVAALAGAAILSLAVFTMASLWPILGPVPGLRNSAFGSLAWAAITTALVILWIVRNDPKRMQALCGVLVVDAMLMT
ncbi:MAG TPA: hypothetical protein VFU92_00285, partial [Usitatibacter sp.]|nr:hypothetical protein [Usitatibacter sp.]